MKTNVAQKLKEAAESFEAGLLTPTEFQLLKHEILREETTAVQTEAVRSRPISQQIPPVQGHGYPASGVKMISVVFYGVISLLGIAIPLFYFLR